MKTYSSILAILLTCAVSFAQEVSIELFKDGFNRPLSLQNANDARLFVVEQTGKIKILLPDGSVNATPFIDLSGKISNGSERGLLGLAFHPNYASNGYFFVNYTDPSGNTQVSRFSVDSANPDLADINSELPIIDYVQPFSNHNGGNLAFGPDGYLYISSGDGGDGGDPGDRAQDINLLLGKLLRIDIDSQSSGENYAIPADNPFVGNPNARGEIWAYGLRNPWRFSFDTVANNIYIGDVGQEEVEEIDRANISEGGLNYGWRCYEGSQPFNTTGCPNASELTFPFAEYSSASGSNNCSVTAGYVYRGAKYVDLYGQYIFADYCSGLIATIDDAGTITEQGNFSNLWVSFGEDVNKELYILSIISGEIYKIKGGVLATPEFDALKISMFPNPASNNITISAGNDTLQSVVISDLKGSVIISEKNISEKDKKISLKNLKSGIYMVQITSTNGRRSIQKLIKK